MNKSCSGSKHRERKGRFFRKTGHVATVRLEQLITVNSEWYTIICLPEMKKGNTTQGSEAFVTMTMCALTNRLICTTAYLTAENINILNHSPYRPKFGYPTSI